MDKTWKRVERAIAAAVGGERVPVTGRQRGSAPDVSHASLAIEVKHRKKLPNVFGELLTAAETLGYDLVTYNDIGSGTRLVLTRLGTFSGLLSSTPNAYAATMQVRANKDFALPALVKEAFHQASASAGQMRDGKFYCPAVFLHQDKMKIDDTFVLFFEDDFLRRNS